MKNMKIHLIQFYCKTFQMNIRIQSPLGLVPVRCRLAACLRFPSFCRWCYWWHSWTKMPFAWRPRLQVLFFQHFTTAILQANLRQHILVLCVFLYLITRWYGLQSLDTLKIVHLRSKDHFGSGGTSELLHGANSADFGPHFCGHVCHEFPSILEVRIAFLITCTLVFLDNVHFDRRRCFFINHVCQGENCIAANHLCKFYVGRQIISPFPTAE